MRVFRVDRKDSTVHLTFSIACFQFHYNSESRGCTRLASELGNNSNIRYVNPTRRVRKCARPFATRGILQARAASRVHRRSGKPQYTLIGVVWFVGTTFYSRRSRRGLSICILCHKCENRFVSNATRDSTLARGNMYQTPGNAALGRIPMKSLLPRRQNHVNCSCPECPRHTVTSRFLARDLTNVESIFPRLKTTEDEQICRTCVVCSRTH